MANEMLTRVIDNPPPAAPVAARLFPNIKVDGSAFSFGEVEYTGAPGGFAFARRAPVGDEQIRHQEKLTTQSRQAGGY